VFERITLSGLAWLLRRGALEAFSEENIEEILTRKMAILSAYALGERGVLKVHRLVYIGDFVCYLYVLMYVK